MKHKKKRKENVVLIGFMGCGKTSVGLRLSFRLRKVIEDTDKIIEQREGRSINEIFAQDGEAYFRQRETQLLKDLAGCASNQIISVGGGTPVAEKNRELLKRIGTVVYLRVHPRTVYDRLRGDDTRPLLKGDNPLQKITQLLGQRASAYEEAADLVVDVDGLDMEEVLELIVDGLKACRLQKRGENENETSGHQRTES